jgi:hypothetical protein
MAADGSIARFVTEWMTSELNATTFGGLMSTHPVLSINDGSSDLRRYKKFVSQPE